MPSPGGACLWKKTKKSLYGRRPGLVFEIVKVALKLSPVALVTLGVQRPAKVLIKGEDIGSQLGRGSAVSVLRQQL
jgi:hypothetical protein